jgi:prophage DNA circulation protein
MAYSKDRLGIINVSLRFVVVDPDTNSTINATTPNTQFSLQNYVSSALSSVSQGFTSAAQGFLSSGIGIGIGAALTAAAFVATAVAVVSDAGSVVNETNGLGYILDDTVTLGRYSNGNLTQAPAALQSVDTTQPLPVIIQTGTAALRADQVSSVATVTQAVADLTIAADGLTAATIGTFTNAVVDVVQALVASQNDPSDQLRSLVTLASQTVISPLPGAAIAGNLVTFVALSVLGNTIQAYEPTSSTDAQNVINTITPVFQTAIQVAGDAFDYDSYGALNQIFFGCVQDMTARGSLLPPLIEWTVPANMPACTLAQLMYQDGGRDDDLILRVNPIHPLFMPQQFVALSA